MWSFQACPSSIVVPFSLKSPSSPMPSKWCSFNKSSFHNTQDCRVLRSQSSTKAPAKTLFDDTHEVSSSSSPPSPDLISLDNPTEADPFLFLMTSYQSSLSPAPLFTHDCQIKKSLATLILDNGSHKNLVAQDLVQRIQFPTTPHLSPYQLGWVHQVGTHLIVTQHCVVTFSIRPFHDPIIYDMSPLDYVDLLLGIPYQEQRHAIYHAHSHQYHLTQNGCTYVLTSSSLKDPLLLEGQVVVI